ncbi:hypothetical protein RPMA_20005 [Tardiphaga alba]|uniref:Uncharacterized protein n=1 Tax=Tardiphaga alba TaxID=340268 RepID=A0ABX8AC87_9BRAD|nr:hypothetical protein [Tardiphaga alba]QUS40867.1 hypothetical protein RPMA_20005 [Tardiphaga alba]
MEALEGLLHLIAFLFRCVAVLFDVVDILQILHGIISFIWEVIFRAVTGVQWMLGRVSDCILQRLRGQTFEGPAAPTPEQENKGHVEQRETTRYRQRSASWPKTKI